VQGERGGQCGIAGPGARFSTGTGTGTSASANTRTSTRTGTNTGTSTVAGTSIGTNTGTRTRTGTSAIRRHRSRNARRSFVGVRIRVGSAWHLRR